ncbi:MAG: ABC transporter ATP-binding protein [Clostridia bacterium]
MIIKKLKPCLKGYGWTAIFSMITIILEVVFEIYIPFIMADLIDVGIPLAQSGDMSYIVARGCLMIAFALLSLGFGILSSRLASVASTGFAKGVSAALFKKVQSFSFANVDKFSTASLVTRLTNDVTNVQSIFMMIIRMCVRSPIMLIGAILMAVNINSELAIIFVFELPILLGLVILVMIKAFPRFQAMLKLYDEMNMGVQENLIAIRVVKAFVRSKHEKEKFVDKAEALKLASMGAEKLFALVAPFAQFVMSGCMVAVCAVGGTLIIGGSMTSGELMSFISYISQILMAFMMLSMIFVNLVLSRASANRIVEVLNEVPDISDKDANPALKVSDGSIEFSHVNFSYKKESDILTLRDINLSIKPGETIGIIGGTGSAKTTLVQLIPRLYDAYSGTVFVGGHDVKDYKLEALRDNVAMVLQTNILFTGTIKENLMWGKENATQEEIETACKIACANEFITSFPDGYETVMGQGGVNVSGGQKQRLCIARALLKNPKIIIFDDSTSAVDTATDAKIREGLKNNLSGSTVIIIAQRIASVIDADRVLVMRDGEIDGFDTPERLLKTNQIFMDVYNSQKRTVE